MDYEKNIRVKILGKGMYGMNRKGWKKMVIKGNGSYLLRYRIKGKGGQGKGSSFSLLNLFDSAVILSSLHERRITEERTSVNQCIHKSI